MVYRDFKGLKLSGLGLGTMRFPTVEGTKDEIDEAGAAAIVDYAMKNGINYYDTAYMYHHGQAELVIGKLLKKYPRDSYYLADKFPGFNEDNCKRVAEIFEDQLRKTGHDRFDFYLFHSVTGKNINWYLDPANGIMDYLLEQKKNGRIGHIGFSCHANFDDFKRFIDAYGEHLEFCQLQVNWFDWTYQDAKKKVELLRERGIGLWVMEPVRGGKLAVIGDSYAARLKAVRPDLTVPAWAFRFIQSIGATMTLSGMSNMQQIEENVATFADWTPLSETELDTLLTIADEMQKYNLAPCTSCRYCTTVCPVEIDIPKVIDIYNENCFAGALGTFKRYTVRLEEGKRPEDCLGCRACEGICPQGIKVADIMDKLK